MRLRRMQDMDLAGKKVFLRCDVNVPLDSKGNIQSFKRISYIVDTINYLLEKRCSIIIASHLGRPKNGYEKNYSLAPVQKALRGLLRWPVLLAPGLTDETTLYLARVIKQKEILILENTRFHPGETSNSVDLSQTLASMADIYINDAYGVSHREHASLNGITDYFSADKRGAGLLMQKEFSYFYDTINGASSPFIAILGGVKVSDKLLTIQTLLEKVDTIIIGGAMAFTFLKALGYSTGNSLVEEDLINEVNIIMKKAQKLGKEIVLPVDFVEADSFGEDGIINNTAGVDITPGYMGLDIGEKSIALFTKKSKDAQTIFWNGPMGAYEMKSFFRGSEAVGNILASNDNLTFVGGGDSISVIQTLGIENDINHISTGGGMSLCLIEGKKLPTIERISY